MAEREERVFLGSIVMPIADENTLGIVRDFIHAGILLGFACGKVFGASGEGNRQFAGGIDFAKQDCGNRIAVLFAGIPRFDDGWH